MGHAHVKNLSKLVVRHVYAKGKASIKELTDFAIKKGETVHASEGEYEDFAMIEMTISEIIAFYLEGHKFTPQSVPTPIFEPCKECLSERQLQILQEWLDADEAFDEWSVDLEDSASDYCQFGAIPWRFAAGWRKRYPDLPLLEHIEN